MGKKGEAEGAEGGGISDSAGAEYGYEAETWPPEEAESLWDDSDDGFFERFYSDSHGAAEEETGQTEEGEAGGYDTEAPTRKAEEGATRIRRCWNPEAGTWKTKKESTVDVPEIHAQDLRQEDLATKVVVLLSGIMNTLERIEAKLDASPQPTVKPAEIKEFASYIKNTNMVETILQMLHNWIDKNERVKALVYIKAAMDAQVLSRPPYNIAEAEFPKKLGSKSLYYLYTGEPTAFTDEEDLDTLQQAISELKSSIS